jgi:hypothetical protein
MPLLLTLSAFLMSGCVSLELDETKSLMERHPKGFRDAVRASKESELFVRDALKTIIELEEQLEVQ